MLPHSFSATIAQRLLAMGFHERDVRRLLRRLYLGPDATPEDLLEVARRVLFGKKAPTTDLQFETPAFGCRPTARAPRMPNSAWPTEPPSAVRQCLPTPESPPPRRR